MTQNDFYVALQFVYEKALDEGWTLDQIEDDGQEALLEFIGVKEDEANVAETTE